MKRIINSNRPITLGDQKRNIPTSSTPDICGYLEDLYMVLRLLRSMQSIVVYSRGIPSTGKKRKSIGKQMGRLIMSCVDRLPRAFSLTQKALENQIDHIKESFRKEPMTGFKKPDSLEKQEPRLDN